MTSALDRNLRRAKILNRVVQERISQNQKWGEQHHPDGTGGDLLRRVADVARQQCDGAFAEGQGTWKYILREEYYEALAETDPDRLQEELIQVAAVAVAWAEDIESRKA